MFDDLLWIWQAFAILSRSRRVDGMAGLQPISVLEIDAYARLRGIRGDDAEELLELVLAMDAELLKRVNERRERAQEKRTASTLDDEA